MHAWHAHTSWNDWLIVLEGDAMVSWFTIIFTWVPKRVIIIKVYHLFPGLGIRNVFLVVPNGTGRFLYIAAYKNIVTHDENVMCILLCTWRLFYWRMFYWTDGMIRCVNKHRWGLFIINDARHVPVSSDILLSRHVCWDLYMQLAAPRGFPCVCLDPVEMSG